MIPFKILVLVIYTLTINGDLYNQGLIRDNYYNLTIDISGSIVNNGQWTNYSTNLTGNTNQYLTFYEEFACENFISDMTEGGIATGTNALRFNGTEIDFNGDSLYMNAGYDSIFINGGYVYDITIIAGAISMAGILSISQTVPISMMLSLKAKMLYWMEYFNIVPLLMLLAMQGLKAFSRIAAHTNHIATITGDLTNNGTIQDNYYNNYLYIWWRYFS